MHRAAHFAKIDLSATGAYADEVPSMGDGDLAANGFQFGAPSDLPGADMAAPGAQRAVARNVAHVDVAASGEGGEVTRDIEKPDVPAFRLQFGGGAPPRSIPDSRNPDAARLDVSALGVEGGGATDISCRDVTCLGIHIDTVATRHGDLQLHPELGISGARRLRRERAKYFHSAGGRLFIQRIKIPQLLVARAVGL